MISLTVSFSWRRLLYAVRYTAVTFGHSRSFHQQILQCRWNTKLCLQVPALDPIKNQLNQFHTLTPFYLRSVTCGSLPFSFSTKSQWNCSSPICVVKVWPILSFLNRPHSELERDNNCCRGKESSTVLHILSVFVALGIQHARWMDGTVVCDMSGVAYHIISQMTQFSE